MLLLIEEVQLHADNTCTCINLSLCVYAQTPIWRILDIFTVIFFLRVVIPARPLKLGVEIPLSSGFTIKILKLRYTDDHGYV